MADWNGYVRGLRQVSSGTHVYLQPDGSWGLNNVALLANHGECLLVDTGVDLPTQQRMLGAMTAAEPAAAHIGSVLLTHWHVDHVHGINAPELRASRIFASQICSQWMANLPPKRWLSSIASLEGDAKRQMDHLLGTKFDFSGLDYVAPTDVFEGKLDLQVGDRKIVVVEAKPCHTRSDSVLYIPDEGVVHCGDLISAGRHINLQYPFMTHLVQMCELMLSWDAEVYIPGHGPLLARDDVHSILEYLRFLTTEARKRYDAGMPHAAAVDDMVRNLGRYAGLRAAENLFFTLKMLYCEFSGNTEEHARRNYPEYLSTQWRLRSEFPRKFPELYAKA